MSEDARNWIEGVPELTKELKALTDQLSKLVDTTTKGKKTFDKQSKSQADLSNKTKQLTTVEKELEKINKRRQRITKQVIFAQEKEKQRVKELREEYKKQTQTLKKQIPFSRKVGQAFAASLVAITGAFAAARGAIKLFKSIINSTQVAGDKLAITIGGIKAGWDAARKSLSSGDLNNFIKNIKQAVEVGKEYTKILDDLSDRNRDLAVTQSESRVEIGKLKQVVDNVNLSNKERIEAAKEITKLETDILKQTQSVKKQAFDAEVMRLAALTGFQEDQILQFIKNYDEEAGMREKAQKLMEKEADIRELEAKRVANYYIGFKEEISKSKKDLEDYTASLTEQEKEYVKIFKSYSKTTDEELDKVTQAYVELQGAEESFLSGTRRSNNQLNTLLKQINKEKLKDTEETEKSRLEAIEEQLTARERIELQQAEKKSKLLNKLADEEFKILEKNLDRENELFEEMLDERGEINIEAVRTQLTKEEEAIKKSNELKLQQQEQLEEGKKELISAGFDAAQKIVTDRFNVGIDERLNSFLEANEAEKQILQDRLDKGLISEEEFARKTKALDLKARQEEAKANKKKSQFDNAINTLVAIGKTFATLGFPAGVIPAAIVAGIGAANGVAIAAEPIPKFWKGVDNFEGGMAYVGDKYGTELIHMPGHTPILSPENETLAYLPKGTDIFPHHSKETQSAIKEKDTKEYAVLKSIDKKLSKQQGGFKGMFLTPRGARYIDEQNNIDRTYINKYR